MPTPPRAAQLAAADSTRTQLAGVHLTTQDRWIVRDPETRMDYPFITRGTAERAASTLNAYGPLTRPGLSPGFLPYFGSPSDLAVYGDPA